MITPSSLAIILQSAPFPGAVVAVTPGGAALDLIIGNTTITFCEGVWFAAARRTTSAHLSFAAIPTAEQVHAEIRRVLAIINAPADDPADERLQDRLTDEIDRRRDAEQALAKMTDAHAVVSQRLIGSQKEVATLTAQHDDWQADIDRAHRERDEATARADKIEDRLRRDDEMREQIAAAVGLDGSASLALILDTVRRDRPAREISRLSGLLDVLAAPVTFGERHLSTVERAEWALRRALRERDECAPRMAQLIDAEVYLDTLGVPAYAAVPSDEPGDASEALTVAERLRFYFGAQS